MTKNESTTYLFEQMPIPGAVAKLAVPMVIANLVTIVYSLADTFFVGMLNDPVQNAAVTLVYPVTLSFYAVSNLFGIGTFHRDGRANFHHQFGFRATGTCREQQNPP